MWNNLAREIHDFNIEMGWWTIDDYGETRERNIGELLCLVHSEISEAVTGWGEGMMDDKLPHRPMLDVELADTAIRILDILGWKQWDIDATLRDMGAFPLETLDPQVFFLSAHCSISNAMEGCRKSNEPAACISLTQALAMIVLFATANGIPLVECIYDKWNYNKTRADHQLANRAADGGKKF